jgi:hypothetical protein
MRCGASRSCGWLLMTKPMSPMGNSINSPGPPAITVAEHIPTREGFPTAPRRTAAGSVVFMPPPHPVPLNNHYRGGTTLKARTGDTRSARRATSRKESTQSSHRLSRRRRVLQVGGQTPADGGRMGIRRSRRKVGRDLFVGQRTETERQMDG